jgi:hypothetical protein
VEVVVEGRGDEEGGRGGDGRGRAAFRVNRRRSLTPE